MDAGKYDTPQLHRIVSTDHVQQRTSNILTAVLLHHVILHVSRDFGMSNYLHKPHVFDLTATHLSAFHKPRVFELPVMQLSAFKSVSFSVVVYAALVSMLKPANRSNTDWETKDTRLIGQQSCFAAIRTAMETQ
jgi:hypothetical protein